MITPRPGGVIIMAAILGCGCRPRETESAPAPEAGSPTSLPARDRAAVCNALVPPAKRDQIVFEDRAASLSDHLGSVVLYTVPVPRGWTRDRPPMMSWRPPADPDHANLAVGFGGCGKEDCAAATDGVFSVASDPRPGAVTVLGDVRKTSRRIMSLRYMNTFLLITAWWNQALSRYYSCVAFQLERDLVPAFECACASADAREARDR